ncbi:MAG: hypothetical protein A4E40_00118 [Methanoregulaceae archaeon PtaU1.Bin059]|nr:MAG: hypothetical protein A4E40_00118 [Methanoregulaceae archaeon PtaU1.Bin059]
MPFIVPVFRVSHRTRFRLRQVECGEWGDCGTVYLSRNQERMAGSVPRYQ